MIFSLTDETEAGEVDKVVLADAQTEVVSARAETGKMIVEGKVIAAVTYVEDGVTETARFDIPFTEEIAAEGVCEGDEILATAAVKNGAAPVLTLLGGWVILGLLGGMWWLTRGMLGPAGSLAACGGAVALGCGVLLWWLRRRGSAIFAQL